MGEVPRVYLCFLEANITVSFEWLCDGCTSRTMQLLADMQGCIHLHLCWICAHMHAYAHKCIHSITKHLDRCSEVQNNII